MNINTFIDHTALKANTTSKDIEILCSEAIKYKFATVCVNPTRVQLCKSLLQKSQVKVCTVVGFPLGAYESSIKAQEAELAIKNGADEIDMVINIQALIDNNLDFVKEDIVEVLKVVRAYKKILKVIIETCLLTKDQIIQVCNVCKDLKVDFVKTSTGFSTAGAKLDDIKIMKSVVKDEVKIKASGGIKNYQDAINFIEAGANRLGTSSGTNIMNNEDAKTSY